MFLLLCAWFVLAGVAAYIVYLSFSKTPREARGEREEREERVDRSPERAPINARGWTLYVDASNVCRDGESARLSDLHNTLRALSGRFELARLVVVCDANLRYHFSDAERPVFERLLARDNFINMPYADRELFARASRNPRSIVVSNDRFRDEELYPLRVGVATLSLHISGADVICCPSVTILQPGWGDRYSEETVRLDRYIQRVNQERSRSS